MITLGAFCLTACLLGPTQLSIVPNSGEPDSGVFQNGTQVGVYVDDSDPDEAADVAAAVAQGWPLVFAGSYADTTVSFPGAITAVEWYPFDNGKAWEGVQPPAGAEAYIVQRDFSWPGVTGATLAQQAREMKLTRKLHPRYIFSYDGT